ncbi:hypothetical protein SAMN04488069_10425 [Hymenobacter psychrophilus]|uniref:Peptidase M1 membrane alanine aminopeptidase domain-containing protein n=2 Tax=Hymenobacter psychrophilus TaxID=651662 RepID=A0A1H3FDS3_9BACT|nr:hypothetical protein SAMN04488069_10425 [Hymenobacter psychrophilus]
MLAKQYFGLLLVLLTLRSAQAEPQLPKVQVQLRADPSTRSFNCHYQFTLPAADTSTRVVLRLNRAFRVQQVQAKGAASVRQTRSYYPYFADTLQRVEVRFKRGARQARTVSLSYSGTLDTLFATAAVLEFSGHTGWLPFQPLCEYEPVDYELRVKVPAGYQVVSSADLLKSGAGAWQFRGRTGQIEITALIGRQFSRAALAARPQVQIVKAGATTTRADTLLLRKAVDVVGFYNRTIGRQDSVKRFTVLLPGTDRDAFGLREDATVITYPDFNVSQRGAELILAHEISHKWWGEGSVHNYNDWLNEAVATYSSLLYLQARGDTAGYRIELNKRAQTLTDSTPAIIGFESSQHPYQVFRQVIYNKGTVVLAALHGYLGDKQFIQLLATAAGRRTSTTEELLQLVQAQAGPEARTWLRAKLERVGR